MGDIGRLFRTAGRVARTRYPSFVLGAPLRGEIPVFTYHDVTVEELTADLEFLRANGYRTLGLDEYLAARERKAPPQRAVLLTFDDARRSFARVALPLLDAFDARAVLFAPTYWLGPPAPHDGMFMSWAEVRAAAASGRVDVQSHAHRHALVAVADRVVDFANPDALARFDLYDWPMRASGAGDELGRPALGTPVYRSEPLLSATRRYLESERVTEACREAVAALGGAEFFAASDWRQRLAEVHRRHSRADPGRFATPRELEALVESELDASRELFRAHLGYAPHALAYPWRLGSLPSLDLARRFGFRAAFGVALDYGAERRRERLPLPVFGRLKSEWLRFLPGHGRRTVLAAVQQKLRGLERVHHLAH